jgi:hypothetical protein
VRLFKGLFRKTTGKTLDILARNFYRSLGMNNTSFNPLESLIKIEFANRNGLFSKQLYKAMLMIYPQA